MSDTQRAARVADRRQADTHAMTRYFKMLEVAYNCAQNGYYERSRYLAANAVRHFEEADVADVTDDRLELNYRSDSDQ